MKTKSRTRLITLTTLALMLLLSSCGGPAAIEIDMDCDAFYDMPHQIDRIEVSQGEAFTVTLCSNPSTGYSWAEDAEISDGEVIRQDSQEFTAPEAADDPPAPGTPGTHSWTFSALQAGESTITLAYSQPWEGGDKNSWTFTLTVVVK
jgi:inhibitor of cysteine peptidase